MKRCDFCHHSYGVGRARECVLEEAHDELGEDKVREYLESRVEHDCTFFEEDHLAW